MGQPYSTAPQGILWGSPIAQPHMSSYGAAPQHNPTWVLMGQPHSTTPHGFLWGSPIAQPHMGSYGAAPQPGPPGVPHPPSLGEGQLQDVLGGRGGRQDALQGDGAMGAIQQQREEAVRLPGVRGRGSEVRGRGSEVGGHACCHGRRRGGKGVGGTCGCRPASAPSRSGAL